MNAVSTYIHYHAENITPQQYTIENLESAKKKIVEDFFKTSLESLKFSNPQAEIDAKTLSDLLDALGGKTGLIGSNLMQNLQNADWLFNADGTSKLPTGAGIINESESDEDPHIPEYAVRISNEVNNRLQNIIDIMSQCGESILVSQLQAVKDNKGLIGNELETLNGKAFSRNDVEGASKTVVSAMERLHNNIEILNSFAENTGGISDNVSYNSLVMSIRNCFNTIGGSLFEVAVKYIGKHSKYYFANHIEPELDAMFANSGGKVIKDATHTGNKTLNGKEVKNDVEMFFNERGIVFKIGINVKLNNQVKQHLGNRITIKNVQKGMTFGSFLDNGIEHRENLEWMEGHIGALKVKKNGKDVPYVLSKGLDSNFNNMKEFCKYSNAAIALTGSGAFQKHDFASLMVVNNKVFSMYDLLKLLAQDFDEFASFSGLPSSMSNYRSSISHAVREAAEKGPWMKTYRSNETINIINRMYARKVSMTLYFSRAMMAL